jgi:DNA-binding XRE family transcriptional regulator
MDETLSPRQCRAARAWLGWTQRDLAKKAGIDQYTVMNFEMGRAKPWRATTQALILIFEQAGIDSDDKQNLILPP